MGFFLGFVFCSFILIIGGFLILAGISGGFGTVATGILIFLGVIFCIFAIGNFLKNL